MSLDSVAVSPELKRLGATRSPLQGVGFAGLLLAVFAVIVEVLAINVGSGSGWGAATALAWLVIGLQAVSFVLGLVALLSRRGRGPGRRFGLAAIVLSLLANPLLLVALFSLLRGSS